MLYDKRPQWSVLVQRRCACIVSHSARRASRQNAQNVTPPSLEASTYAFYFKPTRIRSLDYVRLHISICSVEVLFLTCHSALYLRGDTYETSDAVFGVKSSLLIDLHQANKDLAEKYNVEAGTK